ncbi:Uncharacterised protein [Vibrio cholerae]|nr:Uncharacterised protein [Vibrio cholerae]
MTSPFTAILPSNNHSFKREREKSVNNSATA